MAPLDSPVHRRERVVLKEDVITAIDVTQAVGIVQPSLLRPDVKGGKAGIGHEARGYAGPERSAENSQRRFGLG